MQISLNDNYRTEWNRKRLARMTYLLELYARYLPVACPNHRDTTYINSSWAESRSFVGARVNKPEYTAISLQELAQARAKPIKDLYGHACTGCDASVANAFRVTLAVLRETEPKP